LNCVGYVDRQDTNTSLRLIDWAPLSSHSAWTVGRLGIDLIVSNHNPSQKSKNWSRQTPVLVALVALKSAVLEFTHMSSRCELWAFTTSNTRCIDPGA